jgi:hypothetical protein
LEELQLMVPVLPLIGATVFGFLTILNAFAVFCLNHDEHAPVPKKPQTAKPTKKSN